MRHTSNVSDQCYNSHEDEDDVKPPRQVKTVLSFGFAVMLMQFLAHNLSLGRSYIEIGAVCMLHATLENCEYNESHLQVTMAKETLSESILS
jgi:hypothetical protein